MAPKKALPLAPKKSPAKAPQKAAKKAAGKSAKKAAKKGAAKSVDRHAGRDLRRAYEHLGRMETLRDLLPKPTLEELGRLVHLAEMALALGDDESGADLLRAGEHLCFASLAPLQKSEVSDELRAVLNAECEHLLDRAERHWNDHVSERADEVTEILEEARKEAETALNKAAYLRAMEFARCADALAQVRFVGKVRIDQGEGAMPPLPVKTS